MTQSDLSPSPESKRPAWLSVAGLLALVAALFFVRLGSDVALRSHEALLAETARNMYINHPITRPDGSQPSPWLVPNFNGSDRLKKTPLPYWTVAGLARLTGQVDEWTARLPAAAAAFGTVLIVLLLLRREEDRLTGLLGVAVLATMVEFLNVARLAQADMPMTFFMTASLAALWMGVRKSGALRFAWFILSGAAGGLAMMAKGPVPLIVIPAPFLVAAVICVVQLVRQRREGKGTGAEWAWTVGGAVVAMALFAGVILPWLAWVPGAWDTLWSESVERSMGELGHTKGESQLFYLSRLPFLAAPWVIFMVWGMVLAVVRWHRETADRLWVAYVAAWFVGPLAALSLAEGKQDHYIAPILPAAAIFAAMAMRRLLGPTDPVSAKHGRRLIFAHAVVGLVAGLGGLAIAAYLAWHKGPAPKAFASIEVAGLAALAGISAIAAVGCAVSCVLALRRRLVGSLMALVVTLVAAFLFAWPTFMGPMDRSATAAAFSRQVRARVAPQDALWSYGPANNSVIFYMGRDLVPLPTPEDVQARIAEGRPFSLIVPQKGKDALGAVPGLSEAWHQQDPMRADEGYWLLQWPGR